MKNNKFRYIACILLQSVVYGFGNPLTKIAFESISPFWCLTIRFTFAFLVFLLFFRKRILSVLRTVSPKVYAPTGLCMAVAYISCNLALNWTSATNVGFLMSLPVIFAPILESIVLKQKYKLIHIPVQIAVIVGLYLLCCNGSTFVFGKGEIAALITSVSVAGGLVFGEQSLKQMDAVTVSAIQSGITAIISLLCALIFENVGVLPHVALAAWGVVLYLALTCSCLAFVLQNTALSHLSSGTVSMLQCTQPILTAIISFLLIGEKLGPQGLLGAAIIIICILVENIQDRYPIIKITGQISSKGD